MRCALLSAVFVLAAVTLFAEELTEHDLTPLTPLERFAIDGLGAGSVVFGAPIDDFVESFGLPDRIEVRREGAYWNVDRETVPVEWVYSGFSAMTVFYRDGLDGSGPYRISRTVIGIVVSSSEVELREGLRIGKPISEFLDVLGEPRTGYKTPPIGTQAYRVSYYDVQVVEPVRMLVDIILVVDSDGKVIEISWSPTPAH
jgi:hypothetical protein